MTSYPQAAQLQYQAQPQMTVNGGNRNPANKPLNASGQREWTYDIFDCFGDIKTCCTAWLCPCMIYQSNKSRRKALENGAPHPQGGDYTGSDCFNFGLLSILVGLSFILETNERAALRNRYNIENGGWKDCMATYCFYPCTLTQESREIEGEEKSFIGQHKV